MLVSIKGYYEEGKIILTEEPPVTGKTEVVVTFLPSADNKGSGKIRLGTLEGRITVPDDFDEPLDELKEYM